MSLQGVVMNSVCYVMGSASHHMCVKLSGSVSVKMHNRSLVTFVNRFSRALKKTVSIVSILI